MAQKTGTSSFISNISKTHDRTAWKYCIHFLAYLLIIVCFDDVIDRKFITCEFYWNAAHIFAHISHAFLTSVIIEWLMLRTVSRTMNLKNSFRTSLSMSTLTPTSSHQPQVAQSGGSFCEAENNTQHSVTISDYSRHVSKGEFLPSSSEYLWKFFIWWNAETWKDSTIN